MFGSLGMPELIVIFIIALVVAIVMLVAKSRRVDDGDYVAQNVLTRIKNDYRDNGERR